MIGKNRDSRFHRVLLTVRPPSVIHTVTPDRGKLVTLIAGSNKRRRLLFVGDGRRSAYDKKPQRYAEDNGTAFTARPRPSWATQPCTPTVNARRAVQ